MSKKCINCGAELSENASFCPHCETKQTEETTVKQPKIWRRKATIAAAAIAVIAIVVAAVLLYHAPQTYEGSAELQYTDKDGSYQLLLAFDNSSLEKRMPQDETSVSLAQAAELSKPSQLAVFDPETGDDVWEGFSEKIESISVSTLPLSSNGYEVGRSEPAPDKEVFLTAALVSDITFLGDYGDNEITWTLQLKNGDTLLLHQTIYLHLLNTREYSSVNADLSSIDAIHALLETIYETVDEEDIIHITLPAITYEGKLTVKDRKVSFFGTTEGDQTTTFTDTVTLDGIDCRFSSFDNINFIGNGSEAGLYATSYVEVTNCTFTGWEVATTSEGSGWVWLDQCTLKNNGVGLRFNADNAYGADPVYRNNTFENNDIAVQLLVVPDFGYTFEDNVFSGNGTDIVNETEVSVTADNNTFE